MKEVWKIVESYPNYSISNLGNLKSNITNKLLKKHTTWNEYIVYDLYKSNKHKRVFAHRLVALAFIPKIEGKKYIDHINGIRNDNRAENLRWCTIKENLNFPLAKTNASISHIGAELSESAKEKLRILNSGTGNPMYGKTHSDETKIKISKALQNPSEETRKKIGESHKTPIIQLSKDGKFIKEWGSISEVAAFFNTSRHCIGHCVNGNRKTYKGFIFKRK